MTRDLRVPCSYQGGKQRVSKQLVDLLLKSARSDTHFYDLCCGSGAVSIELVNRGISPSRITMVDLSSWGAYWNAIGSGTFSMETFDELILEIPEDKRLIKAHMTALSERPVGDNEAEIYPLLQSTSFGGKQISRIGDRWDNAFFRDYWKPTATSVRRSPANPMQPSPGELRRRVAAIAKRMRGVTGIRADIVTTLDEPFPKNALVYVDPPYQDTTGYAFGLDIASFGKRFVEANDVPLFVSERVPLSEDSVKLTPSGAKGGITGVRAGRHEEWLSRLSP